VRDSGGEVLGALELQEDALRVPRPWRRRNRRAR
jgi:hypothetical protein